MKIFSFGATVKIMALGTEYDRAPEFRPFKIRNVLGLSFTLDCFSYNNCTLVNTLTFSFKEDDTINIFSLCL